MLQEKDGKLKGAGKMARYSLKKRICGVAMAMVVATSTVQMMPITYVHADKGESIPYATNTFDSNYDAQNAYSGNDLGCTYTKEKTTFKVWSPLATKVVLCRYQKGDGDNVIENIDMTKGDKGVWSVTVSGDIVNTYYTYKVTANGKTQEAVDIYAKAAGVNGDRAMVVDLDSTDPVNWDKNYKREKTLLSDINVWEIHIRDFSIDVSSGVSAENRGKYKAFTESTTVNGEGKIASCVDYLKELGVTHVQLMPMYDYASVDETKVTNNLGSNYNWGYDPENYNVPEGSYSSNPYDGNVRITEMKEMIQALHDAGIKVVMDVVYNHTYDTADSNFNKIMPDYYYKLNSNKSYNDESGCGNATRSTSAMYRKFMIDSISYWAEEYNLDGFRFDLMGIHDVTTMNQIRKTLDQKFGEDTIVMYGEGWTGASGYAPDSAHKANEAQLDDGIGYFNDQIRDALKGEHKFDKTIGLVQHNYTEGSDLEPGKKWPNNVFGGIMGSVGYTAGQWGMWRPFWSKSSNCSLSYCSAHDNLTLWDKLTEGLGKNFSSTDDRLLRMNKMVGAVILTAKGGTFMQAGEEFCRTKNGDDNSYKSSDSVNKIDWNRLQTYSSVRNYYQGMLRIRQAFSGFRSITTRSNDNWNPNNNNLTWISKEAVGVSAFTETNNVAGEWNRVAVIINNTTQETTVDLSRYGSQWVVIADGDTAGLTALATYGGSVKAAGKSVVVAVPKDTFDANPEVGNKNHAPEILVDNSSITTTQGSDVTFTVSTKDQDGDKVTLTLESAPKSVEFENGVLSFKNVQKGNYEIVFAATDGKATTRKTVTITVTSDREGLENAITNAENSGYTEKTTSAEVWTNFQTALTQAKTINDKADASKEEIANVTSQLQAAFATIKEEQDARAELKASADQAAATLKTVDASGQEEAVADANTVKTEADTLLAGVATKTAYVFAKTNLEESMAALAVGSGKVTVHVSANAFATSYLYAWQGSGKTAKNLLGAWPGQVLTEKDAQGNYVITLDNIDPDEKFNVIVNDGATGSKQTDDIEGVSGEVTVNVANSSYITQEGKQKYTAETNCQAVGTATPVLTKEGLQLAMTTAKALDATNYTEDSYAVLKNAIDGAELLITDSNATQVKVNQQARSVRAGILGLVLKAGVVLPTATPVVTPGVSQQPEGSQAATSTQEPDKTTAPQESDYAGTTQESMTPTASNTPAGDTTNAPVPSGQTQSTVAPTHSNPANSGTTNETTNPSGNGQTQGTIDNGQANSQNGGQTAAPTATQTVQNANVANSGTASQANAESDLQIGSFTLQPASYQVVGQSITAKVQAVNGVGSVLYKFEVLQAGKVVASSEYSKENEYMYVPTKAGSYTVQVTIQDDNKAEKTAQKNIYVVSKKLSAKITKKVKITGKKASVALKVKATGGKASYKYKFEVYDANGKKVSKTGYASSANKKLSFSKKGKYTIKVYVKDSLGIVLKKSISCKIK